MSFIKDNYKQYIPEGGNIFHAVIGVGKLARKLQKDSEDFGRKLTDSESLTLVLQGREPTHRPVKVSYVMKTSNETILRDHLSQIEDNQVRDAVAASIVDCKTYGYLQYNYGKVEDHWRQSRVRILVKMIWFEMTT